jgi:hypothetical protein
MDKKKKGELRLGDITTQGWVQLPSPGPVVHPKLSLKNHLISKNVSYTCVLINLHTTILVDDAALNETTTIRVSKKTAETLEHIREKLNAESLDEAIQSLIKKQRKSIIEKAFSADAGRIKPFSEGDRGEDRD